MRCGWVAILISISSFSSWAQAPRPNARQNQLDASPALFTVMAAINAAGYDAALNSPNNDPWRQKVRDAIAARNPESLAELKKIFEQNRQHNWNAELAQYISFAVSIDGPPDFHFRVPENEIPPDVLPLRGLELILPRFYQEAGIQALWEQAQPEYERVFEAYHGPVSQALLEANAYLRNATSGYLGRRFVILVDLLAAPRQVQTRNYKDDYFVVVTPSPEPQVEAIRYAYLHYLIDPLALKFATELDKKRPLADYAEGAAALDDSYKNDYLLLATASLAKAIESRLASGAQRQHIVDQALREGFVLTAAFADGLPAYEKQEQSMRYYFPELVKSINLEKEAQRLDNIQFLPARPETTAEAAVAPPPPVLKGAAQTLQTAEQLYLNRQLDPAREAFMRALEQTDEQPLHARAYYGLARIAALEKNPELSEKLFQKTLELDPDPETRSWALLYLGRLAAAAGELDEAVKQFRAVAQIEGASPKARAEAEKDLEKIHQSQ